MWFNGISSTERENPTQLHNGDGSGLNRPVENLLDAEQQSRSSAVRAPSSKLLKMNFTKATNRVISFVATIMFKEKHLITLSDTLIGVPNDNGGIRLYSLLADLTERDMVNLIAATGRRASAPLQRHKAVSPAKWKRD